MRRSHERGGRRHAERLRRRRVRRRHLRLLGRGACARRKACVGGRRSVDYWLLRGMCAAAAHGRGGWPPLLQARRGAAAERRRRDRAEPRPRGCRRRAVGRRSGKAAGEEHGGARRCGTVPLVRRGGGWCGSGDRVETAMPGGASGRGAGVGRGCGAGVPGDLSDGRPPLAPLVGRRCAGSRRGASWAACGCAGGMQQRVA